MPAKSGIKGAVTRWDELQYVHIIQSDYIHGTVRLLTANYHRIEALNTSGTD